MPRVKQSILRFQGLEKWEPKTMNELLTLAKDIREQFASTMRAKAMKDLENDWAAHDIYFIRDVLLFLVFEQAVSYADAGRMLRVYKYWACFFRGVHQHNYARECAEILIRFKYETPPGLQAAIERSWFFNRFGRDGCWIAADLYLEQLNYWVKVSLLPKSLLVNETHFITCSASSLLLVLESPWTTSFRKARRAWKLSERFLIWWHGSLAIATGHGSQRKLDLQRTWRCSSRRWNRLAYISPRLSLSITSCRQCLRSLRQRIKSPFLPLWTLLPQEWQLGTMGNSQSS